MNNHGDQMSGKLENQNVTGIESRELLQVRNF